MVRGCSAITTSSSSNTTTTTTTASSTTTTTGSSVSSSGFGAYSSYQPAPFASCSFSMFGNEKIGQNPSISEPFEVKSSIEELHELCKPFFNKSHPKSMQIQPLSPSFSYSSPAPKTVQLQTQQKQQQPSKQSHTGSVSTPRSKRR